MLLEKRYSLFNLRSHLQGQTSRLNCWSMYKCCPFNIFWPLCYKVVKHGTVVFLDSKCFLFIFESRVKVQGLDDLEQILSTKYSLTSFLWSYLLWFSGCPFRIDVTCTQWFSGHVVKGQSQNAVCKCCLLNI